MNTAIVTGAGQGIGRAIALRLAQDGYDVALLDIKAETIRAVESEIKALGREVIAIEADLSDIAQLRAAIGKVAAQWGRIDALVNNAGRHVQSALLDVTEADWDMVLGLDLKSVFFAMQAAAPSMIAEHAGRIVNISSISGRSGRADQTPYAAAKAGVISLTRSAALALAPHGINVNAVCPGVVDTPLTRAIHEKRAKEQGITEDESLAKMLGKIPLGRIETPEDVARAVSFLCAPDSSYITGQAINVCGGMEMD